MKRGQEESKVQEGKDDAEENKRRKVTGAASVSAIVSAEEKEVEVEDEEEEGDTKQQPQPQRRGKRKQLWVKSGKECPYLDQIARQRLDFDFEKCCSVSLLRENCYACLVCGKYFQGRGKSTNAYTHALEEGHNMFMNLQNGNVYCLPDGYQVIDRSLEDIKNVLNPKYDSAKVRCLDEESRWQRALDGQQFLPGLVGLNNIKATDYANVVIHSLLRVRPFRNYFLRFEEKEMREKVERKGVKVSVTPLLVQFGELCRKMWNAGAFKGQVSPLELLLAVQERSKRRFRVDRQSDPIEFLTWLLNTLHFDLTKGKPQKRQSIVTKCFQGEMKVTKIKDGPVEMDQDHPVAMETEEENGNGNGKGKKGSADGVGRNTKEEVVHVPFLMLGLDLPAAPLFKDSFEKNIIPQVPLFTLLKKYDGVTISESIRGATAGRQKYEITKLPPHLIVWAKRFTKNNFFKEKNPTIITFPVKNLELRDHIPVPKQHDQSDQSDQSDQKKTSSEFASTKYDLVATGIHEGKPDGGSYRCMLYHYPDQEWYQVEDLVVKEVRPEIVAIAEAYFQIYTRKEKSTLVPDTNTNTNTNTKSG